MTRRIIWYRDPKETGLRSIGARPRGWTLRDNQTGRTFLWVYADARLNYQEWRFSIPRAGDTPNLRSGKTYATCEEALKAAKAYWEKHREDLEKYWDEWDASQIGTRS